MGCVAVLVNDVEARMREEVCRSDDVFVSVRNHLKAGKALLMINGLELGEKQDEGTTTGRVQCKRKRKLRR